MFRNMIVAGAVVAGVLTAGGVEAQEAQRTTKGLVLGAHTSSTAMVMTEDRSASYGNGLGVVVGWGVSERIAVHAVTQGAWMFPDNRDSYPLGHSDVELRYTFGSVTSRWAPSLAVGGSGRIARFELEDGGREERTSVGITAGGGVGYYVSPAVALEVGARYTFGNFNSGSCPVTGGGDKQCATTARVNFGVSWFPLAR